ncbi:hypothetical protein [Gordonia shandongensis]|uniref:hypothetical protein n=1 Tax=Gordonia shandongensis TaxID=376351 RepID=UPI00040A3E2B|nr:hypothetical protein [Gordonia shandongensis]
MLYAVGGLLTALICGPLFVWSTSAGHLLYRDAVAVPEWSATAAAFGIDGSAPRAVPQDGFLAVVSPWIDGSSLVPAITAVAVFAAAIGYGRLAGRLVPDAGTAGQVVAATVAVWNPFVAERLLQGQWSLLTGYAALGWTVLAVMRLARESGARTSGTGTSGVPEWTPGLRSTPGRSTLGRWAVLASVLAAAGLTPTGSVLALVVAAVAAVAVRLPVRRTVGIVALWAVTASPWLVGAAVSSAVGGSGGAALFAARAEPALGTLGTLLGLGGIWNAEAVPGSRTSPWALVATALLVTVVAVGSVHLARGHRMNGGRRDSPEARVVGLLAVLAAVSVIAVAAAATAPGLWLLDGVLEHVPGAGLLRDTQKFVATAVPFVAVAAAACVARLRRWVPAGFAGVAVVALVVAPLPDLVGAGGIRPVAYPADYPRAVAAIGDGGGSAVALWPSDQVRRLSWTRGPSLSPLPRMIDAPVLASGELTVDGTSVDAPDGRVAEVVDALDRGGDPHLLASLGVGWVVVEEAPPPRLLAAAGPPVTTGDHVSVYQIPDAVPAPSPSTASWVATGIAHGAWAACLLAGVVAWAARLRRGRGTWAVRRRSRL